MVKCRNIYIVYSVVKYLVTKIKIATKYSKEFIEIHRPQPLSDRKIENLIQDILNGDLNKDISDNVYVMFKEEAIEWIRASKLNRLSGFNEFTKTDIINGCTQFIDNLYMQGPVQTIEHDYRYHERLNLSQVRKPKELIPDVPLIIAMPFPQSGAIHIDMETILSECKEKNIEVHIDAAWITCCRDIEFDFSDPVIKSFGISLSKGLGLGWNRVGIRWTREYEQDSITIMNDFNMNIKVASIIGLHFIRNLPTDYLWNTYGETYYKICRDFSLTPTNSIYLALDKGNPVGVAPLIRYLEEYGI